MEQAFPAFGRVASSSCGVGRPVLGWVRGHSLQTGCCGGPRPRWRLHLPLLMCSISDPAAVSQFHVPVVPAGDQRDGKWRKLESDIPLACGGWDTSALIQLFW